MHDALTLLPLHAENSKKLQVCIDNQRLSQALLFAGPVACNLPLFINHLMASLLCRDKITKPCSTCALCTMVVEEQHPDIRWIRADKKGGLIKIEQIRQLQTDIYQGPSMGERKFIVIEGAEYMNTASANALLKILEEPPTHACFLLISEQIATIPATIISRCQLWRFHAEENALYLLDTNQEKAEELALVIQALLQIARGEIHYSTVAEQWKTRDFRDCLSLLYRISAQIILIQTNRQNNPFPPDLITLANRLSIDSCFKNLDKINTLQKKLIRNININATLALEDLLMDYRAVAILSRP